ncbi:MAG: hypothetical protein AABY07_07230, partial [Nanoarchaeota archaeon]
VFDRDAFDKFTIRNKCVRFAKTEEDYFLVDPRRSSQRSPYYIDYRKLTTIKKLEECSNYEAEFIETNGINVRGLVPLGIPDNGVRLANFLTTTLSDRHKLKPKIVQPRKKPEKEASTYIGKNFIGEIESGDEFFIIEDVPTTAASIHYIIRLINDCARFEHIHLRYGKVLILCDRREMRANEQLSGLEVHALTHIHSLLPKAAQMLDIDPKIVKACQEYYNEVGSEWDKKREKNIGNPDYWSSFGFKLGKQSSKQGREKSRV